MTKATYTPGPWTALWSKYDEGVVIVQAGMPSMRVLARFDGDGDGPDEQSLADARLIAAAPDMLAALKAAREELEQYEQDATGEGYNNPQLNDVISRAEGSQP